MQPKNAKAAGTLYIVATPIGNLQDITLRGLEMLRVVDTILAEDTRATRKLLSHFGIKKPLEKFERFSEKSKEAGLIERLSQGESIALVSDAGTPAILDPGASLVLACHKSGITVAPIPGPSALTAALSASGLIEDGFVFFGWAPRKPNERKAFGLRLSQTSLPAVLFEAPRRLTGLLKALVPSLGGQRAFIARELTKIHETHYFGTLEELAAQFSKEGAPLKGELVMVIEAAKRPFHARQEPEPLSQAGTKATARALSRMLGLTTKEAYGILQAVRKRKDA